MKFIFCFLLFFCCFGFLYSEENPSGYHAEEIVTGNIHFYGDRYILKGVGKDHGKWFILLESSPLENMIKELELFSLYEIKGNLYTFNQNLYLLPVSFKNTKNITSNKIKTKKKKNSKKVKPKKSKKKTKKNSKKVKPKKSKKKTKKNSKKAKSKKSKKKTKKNSKKAKKKKTKKSPKKTKKKKNKKKIEEENL